jgi:hypothetical protein
MGIAANRAVGRRAANIAHMRIRKDIFLNIVCFTSGKSECPLSSHRILEIGRVTRAISPIPLC